MNQSLDEVNTIAQKIDLDYIQLSGEENPRYCSKCIKTVIKGISVQDKKDLEKAEPYIKGATAIISGLGSLANIYLGFKQLGIMQDTLAMEKDKWNEQKTELKHVRKVRSTLTAGYMA